MALLNLKTDLKDLRFGKDKFRSGNSKQPYVVTRIPATDEPLRTAVSISGPDVVQTVGSVLLATGAGAAIGALGGGVVGAVGIGAVIGASAGFGLGLAGNIDQGNSISLKFPTAGTGGPDFLLRGGSLIVNHIADDYNRLSKFYKDTNGLLFTIKQNLLSRLGTRPPGSPLLVNERLYAPLNTILGAVGSPLGLHVNKQGLNPFQGIGEAYTPNRYFSAMIISNEGLPIPNDITVNNRLIGLYDNILIYNSSEKNFGRQRINLHDAANTNILSYSGGPGSFLGIGRTDIKFATNNLASPLTVREASNFYKNTLSYKEINTLSNSEDTSDVDGRAFELNLSVNVDKGYTSNGAMNVANQYIVQRDFRKILRDKQKKELDDKGISKPLSGHSIANAPPYGNGSPYIIENRTNLGDPGNSPSVNKVSYTTGSYKGASSERSYDRITASPIYTGELQPSLNDLIQFRIGVYDLREGLAFTKKRYVHFRAFLNQISDNYTAEWNSTQYVGRGEKFYNYTGFDRKVSLSWTVAAQSKIELIPMYKKLNYLASVCAPNYSINNYMMGNIVTLTVGGYFYEQTGIITGLSYEMNDENATWEIGIDDGGEKDPSVKELPHLIRVTNFNFTPIHNFVPRLQKLGSENDEDGNERLSYGNERFISLADGFNKENNNYDYEGFKGENIVLG